MSIRFHQSCGTCGRRVEISTGLLGRVIACQHCGAEFLATADEDARITSEIRGDDLLARVEDVLRRADATATQVTVL